MRFFALLRQICFREIPRDSHSRLHVDYKLNAINCLDKLLQCLVRVDLTRYIMCAVTQYVN